MTSSDAHEKLVAALRKMSAQEIFNLSVKAGVHNPDGSLTESYRSRGPLLRVRWVLKGPHKGKDQYVSLSQGFTMDRGFASYWVLRKAAKDYRDRQPDKDKLRIVTIKTYAKRKT